MGSGTTYTLSSSGSYTHSTDNFMKAHTHIHNTLFKNVCFRTRKGWAREEERKCSSMSSSGIESCVGSVWNSVGISRFTRQARVHLRCCHLHTDVKTVVLRAFLWSANFLLLALSAMSCRGTCSLPHIHWTLLGPGPCDVSWPPSHR